MQIFFEGHYRFFFRIFIFFDEVFNTARGISYLMRDDGGTVVNVRP